MGRQAKQKKISQDEKGVALEENSVYDDSLLPASDELARLKEISPDIVPWIMTRTEMEQDARLDFNKRRISLAEKDLNHAHRYSILALFMAFFIVAAFMVFSFFLILNDKDVLGTVFAGGTIVIIVWYFLNTKKRKKNS